MVASYKHMSKLNDSEMQSTIVRMREEAELLRGQILQSNEECT